MKYIPTFEEFINENIHNFPADKIDGKIDFLLNGDYDDDQEKLKDLKNAINKFASTRKRNDALKYIERKLNENNINELNSKETKSLAELIGKGLDPESFYEYLRDYSEDEPDGEYGYSEDDLDLIIKAFDEIKQEALGMTRLNTSQVKNSKLYKSYIKQ